MYGSAPMKLVEALVLRDDPEVVDAHLAFQLNAGVDLVLVAGDPSSEAVADVLEPYVRSGRVRPVRADADGLTRAALVEHGADWVLATTADCFWWPRGEGLKDVLDVIPARYTVVQALVRPLRPRAGASARFWDRLTVRPYALDASTAELRPLIRAQPHTTRLSAAAIERQAVPLRAWYPVEIFDCSRGDELGEGEIVEGLADGTLVEDTRLRDMLERLLGSREASARPEGARLPFPIPGIVDDAAYAVECAAVGEVDLPRLEREVAELEHRIAWLEQRFWPRVWRRLSRLGRSRP